MQSLWGSMLMNATSNPIPACKLNAATSAAFARGERSLGGTAWRISGRAV